MGGNDLGGVGGGKSMIKIYFKKKFQLKMLIKYIIQLKME